MAVKASAQITMTDVTDIDSTCRYYLLQSSTLSKPSKPTTNPPSSSWTKTEPSYTAGSTNSLYFTDLTVYSNGEFSYSDVSLSSSYEAAKAAYNKAVAAQNAANTAQSTANNAQSSATAAAKTATNYIDYSSTNGLQVGNKTSGSWSGFRTQITSSAFNILNAAGETLASYGTKLVELGKNASDAVIKFCNGKAWAGVGVEDEFIIESDYIRIGATDETSCAGSISSYIYNDEYDMQGFADTSARYELNTFAQREPVVYSGISSFVQKTLTNEEIEAGVSSEQHNAGVTAYADKNESSVDIYGEIIRVNGKELPIIETGTWTPVVDGFATTNSAIGNYLRIGDTVIIEFFVSGVCADWTYDSNGFMNITGIPFDPLENRNWYTGGGHWQGGVSNTGIGSFCGYVLNKDTQTIMPRVSYYDNGVKAAYVRPQEGASVYASGTIMYKIAS